MVLGRSTHHQKIAGVKGDLLATTASLWTQVKTPRAPETHDCDERVDLGPTNSIGVPGNAVTPAFVVVAEQAVE